MRALLSFKGMCHFLESSAEITISQSKAVDNILVKRNPKQVSVDIKNIFRELCVEGLMERKPIF